MQQKFEAESKKFRKEDAKEIKFKQLNVKQNTALTLYISNELNNMENLKGRNTQKNI